MKTLTRVSTIGAFEYGTVRENRRLIGWFVRPFGASDEAPYDTVHNESTARRIAAQRDEKRERALSAAYPHI